MSITRLALSALLASFPLAAVAQDAQPLPAAEIDVDALARAKDGKASDDDGAPAPQAAAATPESDPPAAVAPVSDPAPVPADDGESPADPAAAPAAPEVDVKGRAGEDANAEKRQVDACVARAGALLDAAQAGDFDKATRDFDAKMHAALTVAQFRDAWRSLDQFGALTARGQSHPGKHEGYVVVTIPLVFERANLYAQTSCGSDGRIAGFYVKPLQLSTP